MYYTHILCFVDCCLSKGRFPIGLPVCFRLLGFFPPLWFGYNVHENFTILYFFCSSCEYCSDVLYETEIGRLSILRIRVSETSQSLNLRLLHAYRNSGVHQLLCERVYSHIAFFPFNNIPINMTSRTHTLYVRFRYSKF